MDMITAVVLIFYLVLLLYGAISSLEYALRYGQVNYTSWAPPLAPIKIIMTIGIVLMLLQAIAIFFKDLATARGESIR
jgi:TRAP-type mannitol/chloroaromatic compound transport system permease small subunit